ncbi:MAG: hypothetical protein JO332_01635 [Planctomycetaceae bacterium]|nr:hypothetical protein [Planctomycetaceae bacterium]
MAQPCEFELEVRNPGPPVGFWDAFASTVGRLVVPAAGQTSLEDPSSDVSSSERHAYFAEECLGELLEGERMLTPQFSVAGWPDIRPEVRTVYASVRTEEPSSSFHAALSLTPKPLTVPTPLFRCRTRPDRSNLTPLASIQISAAPDAATVSVGLERWLLTDAATLYGVGEADVLRLLEALHEAFQALRRSAPGNGATRRLTIPGVGLLPGIEERLKGMKADTES